MRNPLQALAETVHRLAVFGTVVAVSGSAALYCMAHSATLFSAFSPIETSAGAAAIRKQLGGEE